MSVFKDIMSGDEVPTGTSPPPDNVVSLPPSGFSLDLLSFKGLETIPDLEWLIEGWIPKGGLTMIYGPPKSGKSFVVMALVLALDHGERWLGHGDS